MMAQWRTSRVRAGRPHNSGRDNRVTFEFNQDAESAPPRGLADVQGNLGLAAPRMGANAVTQSRLIWPGSSEVDPAWKAAARELPPLSSRTGHGAWHRSSPQPPNFAGYTG